MCTTGSELLICIIIYMEPSSTFVSLTHLQFIISMCFFVCFYVFTTYFYLY